MLIGLVLWSGLTLLFLWRLKVILLNFRTLVRPGERWHELPTLSVRPLKQLGIWTLELMLLAFFYQVFGVSILAHLTASVVAFGLMFMLRERSERDFLRSLQIRPLAMPAPSCGPVWSKEAADGMATD